MQGKLIAMSEPASRPRGPNRPARTLPVADHNFYRTPPEMTQALLAREHFPGPVWECAAGCGDMAQVLADNAYHVHSTDLVDRRADCVTGGVDFLATTEMWQRSRSIVTNPPYKVHTEFARHALSLPGLAKLALLVPISFLEGLERLKTIFAVEPPARIWVFSKRRTLWREGVERPENSNGGTICFSWFVWERRPNHQAGTQVGWIE